MPAELADRDLERRARPERRLVLVQRDEAADERFGGRVVAHELARVFKLLGAEDAALEVERIEVEH